MYRVTVINGEQETVIHSPYPDPIKLESGVIYNKVNEISTFSFVSYPDMELDAEYFPLTTLIKVFNTKTRKYEFEGRYLIRQMSLTHKELSLSDLNVNLN